MEEFIVRIWTTCWHCGGRHAVGDVLERYEGEGPNDARV